MIKGFFLSLSLIYTLMTFLFLYPSRIREKRVIYLPVLSEDDLPRRGVKSVFYFYKKGKHKINSRAFIVNNRGALFALSPVCSHLGCMVTWHRKKKEFICPCHGGRYDITGRVLGGPPPAPLTRLPLKVEEGKVLIGVKI